MGETNWSCHIHRLDYVCRKLGGGGAPNHCLHREDTQPSVLLEPEAGIEAQASYKETGETKCKAILKRYNILLVNCIRELGPGIAKYNLIRIPIILANSQRSG